MKSFGRIIRSSTYLVLLAATSIAAWAADPPGRVARLEYMTGSVSVQPQGTEDWVQGSANRPLTNADNVWADKDSKAELNLGTALMRIDSESSLTLTNVANEAVQVQLHQGSLNVHIRKLYDGEVYEVDTPNMAFTISKSGDYRFDVDPNNDFSVVTVRKGEGEATGQGPGVKVKSGEQARFSGGTSMAHQIQDAPRPDGFDDWCKVRDEREDHSISARYVAPGVVGAEDLDQNGTWREVPEYGPVWVPTAVAPGWAPYRYGHWAWVAPWGWTWVDDAPWGFAPFHYGRWVTVGGYWGWAPGPYWVRPWYAPALVAWYGGPGWGVSFGFGFGGGFGWCPLGWGEPFFPWWGGFSRGYFRNVNISNTRITNINNVTNNYYNHFYGRSNLPYGPYGEHGIVGTPRFAGTNGAFTAVSRNTLEHGLPVAANAARISANDLRNNLTSANRVDASPTRDSVVGANAGRTAARPSAAAASRPTVSRMTPPASSIHTNAMSESARGAETPGSRNAETAAGRPGETSMSANGEKPSPGRAAEPAQSASNAGRGVYSPGPAGRTVPRPPQSLGASDRSAPSNSALTHNAASGSVAGGSRSEPGRSEPPQVAMNNHYVPRPPSAGGNIGRPNSESPMSRSMSQPSAGNSAGRPSEMANNNMSRPSSMPHSYGSTSPARNVPRPTGQVRPAPQENSSRGGNSYSARSYGGFGGNSSPYRGYGERPTYDSPNGGGGRYSAPSRSYGSSGGYHGGSSGGFHGSSGGHASSGGSHSGHSR
jgi:hypothetical protein